MSDTPEPPRPGHDTPPSEYEQDEYDRDVVAAVACPFCDAKPGEQCVGHAGIPAPWLHTDRENAFKALIADTPALPERSNGNT